jgi:hypothetical protein
MPVTPDNLSPAALRLYEQVRHLEVAVPEEGYDPAIYGYPWATVCAALATPVDDLYEMLALPDEPWTPAYDAEGGPDWSLPWLANFAGVDPDGITSMAELRARIRERPARKRGSVEALRAAVEEELRRMMEAAGLPHPLDGYHVLVIERFGGHGGIQVTTWSAETADAEETSPGSGVYESAGVIRAATRATRGGLILSTSVITGGTWDTLLGTHTDWNDVEGDFATWQDVHDDPSVT